MSESEEHKQLKGLLEIFLGQRECKAGSGRVDACNSIVTAEIECSKTNSQRVCRVDLRHQPDTKGSSNRPTPFASLKFSTKEIEALDKIMRESGVHTKRRTI